MRKLLNQKIIWSVICILLFLFIFTNSSLAINMNQATAENTPAENTLADEAEEPTNTANQTENVANQPVTTSTGSNVPTSTTTTVSTLPESDLGLANILNILLITVGVILILLAIAILIKLK